MDNQFFLLRLSNTSDSDKKIFFLGDSFTWGQGLYLDNWIINKPEIFEHFYTQMDTGVIEKVLQYNEQQSFITKEDIIYKDKFSFTNLVADRLNRKSYKKTDNGGSNLSNYEYISGLPNLKNINESIIIFQFTTAGREEFISITDEEYMKYHSYHVDTAVRDLFRDRLYNVFQKIDNKLKYLEDNYGITYMYLDWYGDFVEFNKEKFVKFGSSYYFDPMILHYSIKIKYKDRLFIDNHLNRDGNMIIADSIIEHINKFGKY